MTDKAIKSITRHNGVAGQVVYTAVVQYPGESELTTAVFSGSIYGTPGPVLMQSGGIETFVVSPIRFGELFDSWWVRRFYSNLDGYGYGQPHPEQD